MCIRIYIFDFKKQTNKQAKKTHTQKNKNKNTKKAKETKEEKKYFRKID